VGTVGRAATTARGVGRIARERADVSRAAERLEEQRAKLEALEAEFEDAVDALEAPVEPAGLDIEEHPVRPRKSDTATESLLLVWTPWWVSRSGIAERAV
jgi:hypothetical protein